MQPTDRENLDYCFAALPTVSRTFALNIRVLPGRLRSSVTVAYLLFRLADTVEDTADLRRSERSRLFDEMRSRLAEPAVSERGTRAVRAPSTAEAAAVAELSACAIPHSERALLAERARVWAAFAALSPAERAAISRWLTASIDGMCVSPMGRPSGGGVFGLAGPAELRRYCWFVAGTVGRMLTELFAEHSPEFASVVAAQPVELAAEAEAFGRGLQLTNILQDVAADFADGRCYLPEQWLTEAGISSAELLLPSRRDAGRAVLARVAELALADLRAALAYTLRIPASQRWLRVFCLWPLLAALRTLSRVVAGHGVLTPGRRPKILRRALYTDMTVAVLLADWDGWLTAWVDGVATAAFPALLVRRCWLPQPRREPDEPLDRPNESALRFRVRDNTSAAGDSRYDTVAAGV